LKREYVSLWWRGVTHASFFIGDLGKRFETTTHTLTSTSKVSEST